VIVKPAVDGSDQADALQTALNALQAGQTLILSPGRYTVSRSLSVAMSGVVVSGYGATLAATNPADQTIVMSGADSTLVGVTLIGAGTTRLATPASTKVEVTGTGVQVLGVTVQGGASAGIFVFGGRNVAIVGNTVRATLADGIHMTDGAANVLVQGNTVTGTGDDLIAVVSYLSDGRVSNNVLIDHNTVSGNYWGRGIAVVGGQAVTISNNTVDGAEGGRHSGRAGGQLAHLRRLERRRRQQRRVERPERERRQRTAADATGRTRARYVVGHGVVRRRHAQSRDRVRLYRVPRAGERVRVRGGKQCVRVDRASAGVVAVARLPGKPDRRGRQHARRRCAGRAGRRIAVGNDSGDRRGDGDDAAGAYQSDAVAARRNAVTRRRTDRRFRHTRIIVATCGRIASVPNVGLGARRQAHRASGHLARACRKIRPPHRGVHGAIGSRSACRACASCPSRLTAARPARGRCRLVRFSTLSALKIAVTCALTVFSTD
jgi:hypothetical protein